MTAHVNLEPNHRRLKLAPTSGFGGSHIAAGWTTVTLE